MCHGVTYTIVSVHVFFCHISRAWLSPPCFLQISCNNSSSVSFCQTPPPVLPSNLCASSSFTFQNRFSKQAEVSPV